MVSSNLIPTKGKSFIFIYNLNNYGIDTDKALSTIPSLEEISKAFFIDKNEVISILKELDLPIDDLFEFSTYGNMRNSFLIAENGVYSENFINKKLEKVYRNVYIVPKHRSYGDLIELVFSKKYPGLYNNEIFKKKVKRFSTNFSVKPTTCLDDIHFLTNGAYDLTCGDIVNLIQDPNYINSEMTKSKFRFYDCKAIYLELEPKIVGGYTYDQSLTIPITALLSKKWSEIENVYVQSIKTNGGWFSGSQKESGLMDKVLVQKLKELFFY